MLPPAKYLLKAGSILMATGVVCGTAGGIRLFRFFITATPVSAVPTTAQFITRVIIPHIFFAVGLGFSLFGFLLIAKAIHFQIKNS